MKVYLYCKKCDCELRCKGVENEEPIIGQTLIEEEMVFVYTCDNCGYEIKLKLKEWWEPD